MLAAGMVLTPLLKSVEVTVAVQLPVPAAVTVTSPRSPLIDVAPAGAVPRSARAGTLMVSVVRSCNARPALVAMVTALDAAAGCAGTPASPAATAAASRTGLIRATDMITRFPVLQLGAAD